MPRRKPAGVIRQLSRSGSRGEDGLEFIRCVGGREPQIHKLWNFSEDGINLEVHPFARIDVSDLSGDCFHTAYATEIGRRVFIYGRKSINGSVEWLCVPYPSCGTGVVWTENIYVTDWRWGDGRGYKRWASATPSRPRFGERSVPLRDAVPFRPKYVPSSPENARAREPGVHYVCLQERHMARAQDPLHDLYFDSDEQKWVKRKLGLLG